MAELFRNKNIYFDAMNVISDHRCKKHQYMQLKSFSAQSDMKNALIHFPAMTERPFLIFPQLRVF